MLATLSRRLLAHSFSSGGLLPRVKYNVISTPRHFSSDNDSEKPEDLEKLLEDLYKEFDVKLHEPTKSLKTKFLPFKDDDATTIYDIDEERNIRRERGGELPENLRTKHEVKSALMEKLHSDGAVRGESGVFDIQELASTLKKEKCKDICVMDVGAYSPFYQHMVIVSCKSKTSMLGISRYLRKLYKYKSPGDAGPLIEGLKGGSSWLAMDLGNIVVHLFLPEMRATIDLESLWGIGASFDGLTSNTRENEDFIVSPLDGFTPLNT
uniref:C7orf30 homolog n=1 Tax=Caligus clemensi TaxID=344056 RepID=C1C302_CALCM|nr:C7orf30 homolog [Caligus clemensi]